VRPPSPVSAFVAARRGSHGGRGNSNRGSRGGRDLPNKCSGCRCLDNILSAITALNDSLLKWTFAKRKLIVQKHGNPNNTAPAHVALLSDLNHADPCSLSPLDLPILEECTDIYDDTQVSVFFSSVAFSSSLTPGRDLSAFKVVDSACFINLTAFRGDFVAFEPPSGSSRIGGVGFDVQGSGVVQLTILLVYDQIIHQTIHAVYTPDLSSWSAHRIGRLLSVSWTRSHCGCEFPNRL
jgi:hypothetical protein